MYDDYAFITVAAIRAKSLEAQIEGMKAENRSRELDRMQPAYTLHEFSCVEIALEEIAISIEKRFSKNG